jgi:hypothetical protein
MLRLALTAIWEASAKRRTWQVGRYVTQPIPQRPRPVLSDIWFLARASESSVTPKQRGRHAVE